VSARTDPATHHQRAQECRGAESRAGGSPPAYRSPAKRKSKKVSGERGICSTCKHAERCLFLKATLEPIWTCEEFDEGVENSAKIGRAHV
jgi:hypothetical protein